MAYTDINREDCLVQATLVEHLEKTLGRERGHAWNREIVGPDGMLGRASECAVEWVRHLWQKCASRLFATH